MQSTAAGAVAMHWSSDPFGDYLNATGSATDATEQHFTGKERDSETGFANGNDYFGARYYSSSTGRFLSPDWSAKEEPVPYAKLDDPLSLNLYAYMMNNPLAGADADGHAYRGPGCRGPCPHFAASQLKQYLKDNLAGAVKGIGQAAVPLYNAANYVSLGEVYVNPLPMLKTLQYSDTTQAVAGFIAPLAVPGIGEETDGVASLSKGEILAANSARRADGEAKVAQELVSEGYKIQGSHVGV